MFAEDEVKDKINYYTEAGDYNAIKVWYEIEEALKEIQGSCVDEKKSEEVVS